jgi:DNA polymerase
MNQLSISEKQDSLDVLFYQIRSCKKCGLSVTRKHALTDEGNINASIMFVALSPGAKENVANRMFVGPSGQIFNELLNLVGIDRNSVFMSNLVKCMLPNNRKPNNNEIETCSYFLSEEISIIEPEIIVPLGTYATHEVMDRYSGDPRLKGTSFTNIVGKIFATDNMKIFPLPHPAALLYTPSGKQATLEKYKTLKSYINREV